jgi:glycine/D-amino acid oxidase-like deaminating enzyme
VVIGAGALGLSTALHCAMSGRSVAVVERHTAGSQASGRAAGLFKSVQADELRTRLARRSIAKAVTFADWASTPLAVARSGSFLIARTARRVAGLAGARVPVTTVRHQLLITAPDADIDPADQGGRRRRLPAARPRRPHGGRIRARPAAGRPTTPAVDEQPSHHRNLTPRSLHRHLPQRSPPRARLATATTSATGTPITYGLADARGETARFTRTGDRSSSKPASGSFYCSASPRPAIPTGPPKRSPAAGALSGSGHRPWQSGS